MFEPKPLSFWSRKQGDIIPIWNIVIWEDLEETSKFTTIKFKGGVCRRSWLCKSKVKLLQNIPLF